MRADGLSSSSGLILGKAKMARWVQCTVHTTGNVVVAVNLDAVTYIRRQNAGVCVIHFIGGGAEGVSVRGEPNAIVNLPSIDEMAPKRRT
jgi:hypothetical protein